MSIFDSVLKLLEPGVKYRAVIPRKIPVGGSVTGKRKPGLFKVYVPSRDGFTLELKTTAGSLSVTAPDGTPAKDAKGQLVQGGATVKFDLPEGVFGWFGVVLKDSTSYTVSARLFMNANAKERDGAMLVPWHFFYFPFTSVEKDGAGHPSAKWQAKFGGEANTWEKTSYWKGPMEGTGKSGSKGHGITEKLVEEYNKWAGQKAVDYANCWWWGHCDAASVASTLFAPPKGGGGFADSDLKYFGTEIAMKGYSINCVFYLGGLERPDRSAPAHKEKPEDKLGQALDFEVGPFHDAIIGCIKKKGFVALVDMRADWESGKDKSPDVWNQATYKFTMEAVQATKDTTRAEEESRARALEFKTVLFANADAHDATGTPENPPGSGWMRECKYVLHFDDKGKAVHDHPKNNYMKCTWDKTGKEYYAPRYVFEIKGLNPAGVGHGNPHITLDKAKQLGLALRPTFGG